MEARHKEQVKFRRIGETLRPVMESELLDLGLDVAIVLHGDHHGADGSGFAIAQSDEAEEVRRVLMQYGEVVE